MSKITRLAKPKAEPRVVSVPEIFGKLVEIHSLWIGSEPAMPPSLLMNLNAEMNGEKIIIGTWSDNLIGYFVDEYGYEANFNPPLKGRFVKQGRKFAFIKFGEEATP